ncbi:MAG: type II secretion system F family protein [Acidobacteriota bacterium]|nr:type II secretion system F family protein [Acidobacteriota bacterium]
MSAIVIACFLFILAALLLSISLGLRFYEGRRKRKLVSMLRTVTSDGEEEHINLLIDPDEKKQRDGVASMDIEKRIATLISDAGMDWTTKRFFVNTGVGFFIGSLVGLVAPIQALPVLARALCFGLLAAVLPLLMVRKKRAKRLSELEAQLPDALDFLARSMRAGHAFSISLEMVGEEIHDPLGQEFRSLFNEQNLGASLDRALMSFAKRVPLPDVRFFSSAVLLQRQTGGNLSEILNRLSHIIRERFRLKGQVKAASAHGRLTATILTLLPIATLAGLMLTSPGYLDPMLNDSTGRRVIAGGVVAQIIGNFFIRKVIRIKV